MATIAALLVRLRGDVSGLVRSMVTAATAVEGFKARVLVASRIASFALAGIGFAFAAIFTGAAIKAAIDFETAFTGVIKTVGGLPIEMDRLSAAIRQLATEIPVTAVELARIGQIAGQLGVRGVANITRFIETVARIGVATDLTTEEAAIGFARLSNVMEFPIEQVDKLASAVVALGNTAATNEPEILAFAQRIGGAANVVGLTAQAVLALSATLPELGIRAELGGTAMQRALLRIQEAVFQAGDGLQILGKITGLTATRFAEIWNKDAFKGFQLFVEALDRQGTRATQILNDLRIGGERSARTFLLLAQRADILEANFKTANANIDNTRELMSESNRVFATTAAQWQLLKNRVTDFAITLGTDLLPTINLLIQGMQKLPLKFIAWIVVIGTVTAAIVGLVLVATTLTTAMAALRATTLGAALAQSALAGPIGIGALIVALAVGVASVIAFNKALSNMQSEAAISSEAMSRLTGLSQEQARVNRVAAQRNLRNLEEQRDAQGSLGDQMAETGKSIDELIEQNAKLSRAIKVASVEADVLVVIEEQLEEAHGALVVTGDELIIAMSKAAVRGGDMAAMFTDVDAESKKVIVKLGQLTARALATSLAMDVLQESTESVEGGTIEFGNRIDKIKELLAFEGEVKRFVDSLLESLALEDPFSTESVARDTREAARSLTELADAAREAKTQQAELERELQRQINTTRQAIDQFMSFVVTALRNAHAATRDAALQAIDDERKARQKLADDAIKLATDTMDAQIKAIEGVRDAQLRAIDEELGIIDAEDIADERAEIERKLKLAFDPRERAELEQQLVELERNIRREELRDKAADIRANAAEQIKIARETAAERIRIEREALEADLATFDAREKAVRDLFARQTESWRLELEAQRLMTEANQDELIKLLEDHFPQWETAGLTFSERLADGLRNGPISAEIDNIFARIEALNTLVGSPVITPIAGSADFNAQAVAAEQAILDNNPDLPGFVVADIEARIRELGGTPTVNVVVLLDGEEIAGKISTDTEGQLERDAFVAGQ